MQQQAERPRPTVLDIVAAVLCLLYAGLFIVVGIGSPFLLINLCVATISFFAAFSLIRCAYQLARVFQYLIAFGLGFAGLWIWLAVMWLGHEPILKDSSLYLFGVALLGLLLAILHLFVARSLRHRV